MYIRFNNADVSATNPVPIEIIGSLANVHTFHNAAVVAADGTAFTVGGYKSIVVDIDGAPTSHTILFKYTGANGVAKTLKGMRISDWSTATSTTTSIESWLFDVTGLTTVIMDISAMVAGAGSLTITGTVVA